MIIRDIHKNSLCTQSSIGTLWTGLNHPIAHNPYSLSRVSPEAQCSKAPRFHQCSTPAARRVPAKWGNPTPLSTVPQNQVGKIVEARLRFGTAEVSGFSRPSHFRPSGKSRRFFVHRPWLRSSPNFHCLHLWPSLHHLPKLSSLLFCRGKHLQY